jgi:hypothetical protein
MRTDYAGMNLVHIQFSENVVQNTTCDGENGVVFCDVDKGSKEAMTFALTALASGVHFSCYSNITECSNVTGANYSFPICTHYPAVTK